MSYLMLFRIFASQHDDDLASRFCSLEMSDNLFECASDVFFMYLRDLPGHADLPVCAEHLGKLLERLQQSIGRLIEDHGTCLVLQTLQSRLPSFLLWQEALEAETVAGQPR